MQVISVKENGYQQSTDSVFGQENMMASRANP